MSLLVDLQQHAEDPAYAEAAARAARTARPSGRLRPRRRLVAGTLVVALVGLTIGTAAATVRRTVDRGNGRTALVAEIQDRTAGSDALARQAAGLRADVARRQEAALAGDDAAELRTLELAAAAVAVSGPGVTAVLDDRPASQTTTPGLPRGGQAGSGRVLDRDLQELVNGLWAAGAEAVSVNDLRLTARTAIRSAGEAILVDFRPISPPYVVRAIGDPGRMEATFVDGAAGRRLATYTSLYGLGFDVRAADALHLPAGTLHGLRAAEAVPS